MLTRLFLILAFALLPAPGGAQTRLSQVDSWAYQLQEIALDDLISSTFDVVVIDYSRDGSQSQAFSSQEIGAVRATGKVVLAYLSIGEAEDYRYYFRRGWVTRKRRAPCGVALNDQSPQWLDRPNRNWCGNYKTKFWNREWQRVVFGRPSGRAKSYLDRIIDAGFSGVYLDIIDGYEYWREQRGSRRRASAATDMGRLVIALARYARETRGRSDFIVIPQNGSGILEYLSPQLRTQYLAAIDGIGAEDTFYFGDEDENNPLAQQTGVIENLGQFRDAGKPVFSIDYLTEPLLIESYKGLACSNGFIPQVSVRALDRFETNTLAGCDD